MDKPYQTGDKTEAIVLAELVKRDLDVAIPYSSGSRYDLLIDEGDRFNRVQVKTGRLKDGSVRFNTKSSTNSMTKCIEDDYHGDVDSFIVYCPDNEGLYYVPIDDVGTSEMWIRVEEAKNGQTNGINFAEEYRFENAYVSF